MRLPTVNYIIRKSINLSNNLTFCCNVVIKPCL